MVVLVVILVIVHASLSSTYLKANTPVCDTTEGYVILGIISLMMAFDLVFIFLIYKMKHVTDAFSINNELKLVCTVASFHIGIALWLQSSRYNYSWPEEPYIGYVTASLVLFCMAISVLWPLLQSYSKSDIMDDLKIPSVSVLPERTPQGGVVEAQFVLFLRDPVARKWFQEFLINEFSVENILFWHEVQDYKQLSSQEELSIAARKIYDKYIVDGSPFQVNLCEESSRTVREGLRGNVDKQIFELPEAEILGTMKGDAYPRFRTSIFCTKMMKEIRTKSLDVQVATAAQLI